MLAGVKRLAKLGMVTAPPGMSALDMNSAEDAVVRHTREVVEGFVLCGMEVSLLSCGSADTARLATAAVHLWSLACLMSCQQDVYGCISKLNSTCRAATESWHI